MRVQQIETSAAQWRVRLAVARARHRIWWAWTYSCLIGTVLALTISAVILSIVRLYLAEYRSGIYSALSAELVALAAILEGAFIGYFQWRALRRVFPTMSSGAWVGATIIAAGSGFVLSWLPTSFALSSALANRIGDVTLSAVAMARVFLVTGALVGLVWGAAQFAVLRLHVHDGGAWIVASTITWAVGFPALAFAAFWPDRTVSSTFHVLLAAGAGIVLGSLSGVLQGPVLVRLPSRLLHADPSSGGTRHRNSYEQQPELGS